MAFFITNQIRKTISSYGAGYTTFGGMAVGFYSSARIELFVKGKKTIKGKRIVGIDVIAKIKKNKVHIPYMEAKFPIYFNHGIDEGISVMHMAEDMGIASRAGSWRTIKLDGTPIKYQTKTWNKKVWIPHRKAVLRALNKAAARWLEE
jgi:recombination protein RecA